jgi:hypothetical protein
MSRVLQFSVSVVSSDPAKKAAYEAALEALAVSGGYSVVSANVYAIALGYSTSVSTATTGFCDVVDMLSRVDIDSVTVAVDIGDVVFA